MMVELPDVPIASLVETYEPDVVVEMLGVNDLVFFGAYAGDGGGPHRHLRRRGPLGRPRGADGARRGDPDLVPGSARVQLPAARGRCGCLAVVPGVVVADTDAGHDRFAHTWDESHPNALGEAMIAAAVADALAALGIGPPASRSFSRSRSAPASRQCSTATPGDGGATLSWPGPPGATAEYVWLRDVTAREEWRRLPWPVAGPTWQASLLVNGHRYRFRLQPVKGDEVAAGDVRSNVVEVLPQRLPAAVPKPRLEPRSRAFGWAGAPTPWRRSYLRLRWPVGSRSAVRTRTVKRTSTRIGSLSPRKRYAVTVIAVNGTGTGPVS